MYYNYLNYFLENGTFWYYNILMRPIEAYGIANSVDPDQTAPFGAV